MLKNLKVRTKLLVSFGVIIILYLIAVVFSLSSSKSISNNLEDFYTDSYPAVRFSNKSQATALDVELEVYKAYQNIDSSSIQSYIDNINTKSAELNNSIKNLQEVFKDEPATLQKVNDAFAAVEPLQKEAIGYITSGDKNNASKIIEGDYANACTTLQNSLVELTSSSTIRATNSYEDSVAAERLSFFVMIILAIISVILTIMLVISVTKGLRVPISEIEAAVKEMAKGNMKSEVTYQSNDELGSLAENLRFVLSTLSEYIHHICSRLDSLANGDFSVSMDMDYLGEFKSIQTSGNQIIDSLNSTMGQIQHASVQVSGSSEQVSSGAQALSQGATEQASSVEELAATINDLSNQVSNTAQNSRAVNELIDTTSAVIEKSGKQMQQMMEAMTKINDSSCEIEKITKLIEDIAFQTNILSLNASVEAARAGSAGKGFAVVADEVGSLAARSAEAVKDIAVLIGNSSEAVANGNQIAHDTYKSLEEIVEYSKKISENMAKVTEASDMQAEGISQVTIGIDQISSVVQTNSATAEESAAASEELFGQSSILKELVSKFKLK